MNEYKMLSFSLDITMQELKYLIKTIHILHEFNIDIEFNELKRDILIGIRKIQIIKNIIKNDKISVKKYIKKINKKMDDFCLYWETLNVKMEKYGKMFLDDNEENE